MQPDLKVARRGEVCLRQPRRATPNADSRGERLVEVGRIDVPLGDEVHPFASPQFKPMCGSTSPLSGAPGNVSEKPSIIDCLRISAARSA